jgi:hypothetical protein
VFVGAVDIIRLRQQKIIIGEIMARIKMVEFLTAAPEAREEYDKQIKLHGRITN